MKIPEEVKKAFEGYLTYEGCKNISVYGGNGLYRCAKEMRMYLVRYESPHGEKCSTALIYDPVCGVFMGYLFDEYPRDCENELIREMFARVEEFCQYSECSVEEEEEHPYKIQSDVGTEWENV